MNPTDDDGGGGSARRGRRKVPARTRGRRKALDVLFEADQRGLDPAGLAQNRLADDGPSAVFARSLVEGVVAHAEQIDEALETYSLGWPLAKMPAVDRSIARLGAFEILFSDGVPDAVVMGEAADLAGILSTDRSPNFISGLLGRISEMK